MNAVVLGAAPAKKPKPDVVQPIINGLISPDPKEQKVAIDKLRSSAGTDWDSTS